MKKLLRAGCLIGAVALGGCQGDAGSTQTPSSTSAPGAAAATQPLTLTTNATGLVPQTTAKGTTVQLEGRFQSAVVAHRHADGTIATGCHDEQHAAEAFMQGGAPSRHEVK